IGKHVLSKASSGAMEVFDVYSTDDLRSFLKAKTAEGWEVVGTVSNPEDAENIPVISCLEFRWNKPIIIVIGSEGDGLSLETQLLCHRMLAIPPGRALHPGIESLNVSVATGKTSSEHKGVIVQISVFKNQTNIHVHRMILLWFKVWYLFISFCLPTGILLHSICSQKLRHGD
uniref:Mitochondrial rRNA methyltransferase 1 n=1 Tax=Athene cunicularia TaxID=194338 RepID=A0A663MAH8_ATHCN